MKVQYILIVIASLLFVACGGKQRIEQRHSEADSIVNVASKAHDYGRAIMLVDSLEARGDLSVVKANTLRGRAYRDMEQQRTAEFYFKKALEADRYDESDVFYYCKAASLLAEELSRKGDYEGVLRTVMPVVGRIETTNEHVSPDDYAFIYTYIGNSQLNLGRIAEASKSYERAFHILEQAPIGGADGIDASDIIISCCNNVVMYLNAKQYALAQPWVIRTDSLLACYSLRADARPSMVDYIQASTDLCRAEILHGLGRTAEADMSYQRFKATQYAKTDEGHFDATDYLLIANRYQEAADNFRDLDRCLHELGWELTLDNIRQTLVPKFRANFGAGRKDSTIVVARQIVEALDSAIVKQKQNDAAELATIYDTQQKEAQIAQQRADLSRQRMIATAIALALVIVFFVIYALYRRKTQRRLAEQNEQLEEKNEQLTVATARAEEASRMKTNFIQQISHEIRTPLNVLSGFTQVLTTTDIELDAATKADINQKITENTDRITGLVNKMLELSEANSMAVIERTDLVPVVQIAAQAIDDSGIVQAVHVDFSLRMSPEAESVSVQTNLAAATRSLVLLLDNAQKFTRAAEAHHRNQPVDGKEQVTLRVDVQPSAVAFTVEDTGIGIPASEAERVFDEFVQLDEYYDGTGIGLTVARSTARRLGGDVTLDTGYTAGARFVLTLPSEDAGKV